MKEHADRWLQFGIALVMLVAPAFAGTPVATPEPATVLLIGGGLGALILVERRRRARK